ncbi:hypothetical protein TIFTF001_013927 [Ficus carica]|uniref:Uncharacterized protein n=1 Tax=Ficus carica TaxID=3494 RepID=A0AA88D555_FICCA|nr:hypothetical protein TIFTF001_013927 [Ficus carica]
MRVCFKFQEGVQDWVSRLRSWSNFGVEVRYRDGSQDRGRDRGWTSGSMSGVGVKIRVAFQDRHRGHISRQGSWLGFGTRIRIRMQLRSGSCFRMRVEVIFWDGGLVPMSRSSFSIRVRGSGSGFGIGIRDGSRVSEWESGSGFKSRLKLRVGNEDKGQVLGV